MGNPDGITTALVESPVHGNGHAGFGGRPAETDRWRHRHRAAGRPHTFRLVARQDRDAVKRGITPIHTAPTPDAAAAALEDLDEKWGRRYGAMIRLWRNAWVMALTEIGSGADLVTW